MYSSHIRGTVITRSCPTNFPALGDFRENDSRAVWDMQEMVAPVSQTEPEIAKELEHLYAQLSAVEALIRALKKYRQFYPELVSSRKETA